MLIKMSVCVWNHWSNSFTSDCYTSLSCCRQKSAFRALFSGHDNDCILLMTSGQQQLSSSSISLSLLLSFQVPFYISLVDRVVDDFASLQETCFKRVFRVCNSKTLDKTCIGTLQVIFPRIRYICSWTLFTWESRAGDDIDHGWT